MGAERFHQPSSGAGSYERWFASAGDRDADRRLAHIGGCRVLRDGAERLVRMSRNARRVVERGTPAIALRKHGALFASPLAWDTPSHRCLPGGHRPKPIAARLYARRAHVPLAAVQRIRARCFRRRWPEVCFGARHHRERRRIDHRGERALSCVGLGLRPEVLQLREVRDGADLVSRESVSELTTRSDGRYGNRVRATWGGLESSKSSLATTKPSCIRRSPSPSSTSPPYLSILRFASPGWPWV